MDKSNSKTLVDTLFEQWQSDVHGNEHFSELPFVQDESAAGYSKDFLAKLSGAISTIELPDFSSQSMNDVFQFWSGIHKDHQEKGLSSKDTAMMIFSFKSSLIQQLKDADEAGDTDKLQQLRKLRNLLDLLGLLTFEVYSSEKDQVIERKTGQLHYLQNSPNVNGIVGESPEMAVVFRAVGLVLENDVSVLLEGESGTGKDLIAQMIHSQSKRKDGPFITLNCAAIPKDLLESELFGHEKGAFTGAEQQRLGKFELADNGTLFLDEIGDMPLDMQSKLLRVLQNREVERVGGKEKVKVNVRVIAATHRDLEVEVREKRFRLDLFYRLNVFPIRIPPLRERRADIMPLAQFFISKYAADYGISAPDLTSDALQFLERQAWPGNIRELENLMQRAVIISNGDPISVSVLQFKPGELEPTLSLAEGITRPKPSRKDSIRPLEDLEKEALEHAILHTKGNIRKAATELGISRTTFYNKAKKYGIELD